MKRDSTADGDEPVEPASVALVVPEDGLGAAPEPLGPKDVLRHFLAGRNPSTLAAYRRDLRLFAHWSGATNAEAGMAHFLAVGPQHAHSLALGWLASMADAGLSPATRSRRLAALRSFVTMAGEIGAVRWALTIRGPKVVAFRDTKGPSVETLQRVLASCGDGLEGLRNRALVLTIFGLGLRRAEAARLTVADYDHEARTLRIFGKGSDGQPELLTLPEDVMTALDIWLCTSRGIGCNESVDEADPSTPIFIALDRPGRGALSPSGIYHVIRTLGERVGVRLRPHGLRHAAVTTVLDENGGNVRMAQSFARHSNPSTTMVYDDRRRDLAGEAARLAVARLIVG